MCVCVNVLKAVMLCNVDEGFNHQNVHPIALSVLTHSSKNNVQEEANISV